jgi:hypothetical protein
MGLQLALVSETFTTSNRSRVVGPFADMVPTDNICQVGVVRLGCMVLLDVALEGCGRLETNAVRARRFYTFDPTSMLKSLVLISLTSAGITLNLSGTAAEAAGECGGAVGLLKVRKQLLVKALYIA